MKLNNILGIALGNFWRWEKNPNRASLIKYAKQFNLEAIELTLGKKEEVFAFSLDKEDLNFLRTQKYVSIHAPFNLLSSADGHKEVLRMLKIFEEVYKKVNAKTVVFHPNEMPSVNVLKSDFSTSVSLVAMWKNQGPKKPTRAVGEHATSL
ncbi:MAG: hypothetical protein ACOCQG_01570 [Candidatus Nanoarchaeia archaeon]